MFGAGACPKKHSRRAFCDDGGIASNRTQPEGSSVDDQWLDPDAIAKEYLHIHRQHRNWAANEDHHALRVPIDWRHRVEARGLATLGGMMTLDAHLLESVGKIELFAATWASQGRGFDVRVNRCFIALMDGENHHAETVESAPYGIRREAKLKRSYVENYNSTVEDFVARYTLFDGEVTLDDARVTGSCEFGIRSWCERVGIDYSIGKARIEAVLAGFSSSPQVEVRRAVIHAVRHARRKAAGRRQVASGFNRSWTEIGTFRSLRAATFEETSLRH